MKPVHTETVNTIFTAEGCFDLPATVMQSPGDAQVVETCWELSPEELAVVQQTGKVYLSIVGGQPPVCLSVVSLQEP